MLYLHDPIKNKHALVIAQSHLNISEQLLDNITDDLTTSIRIQEALILFFKDQQTEAIEILKNLKNNSLIANHNYQVAIKDGPVLPQLDLASCVTKLGNINLKVAKDRQALVQEFSLADSTMIKGATFEIALSQHSSNTQTVITCLNYNDYISYRKATFFFEATTSEYNWPFCDFQIGDSKNKLNLEYDFNSAIIIQSQNHFWYYLQAIETIFIFNNEDKLSKIIQMSMM